MPRSGAALLPLLLAALARRGGGAAEPRAPDTAPLAPASGATPVASGVSYWHGNIEGSNAGTAGYSFYENVFDFLQEGFPLHAQVGLPATWFTLDRDEGQAVGACACPKFGIAAQCCDQVQSWCTGLAWSIEGSGGYWRDTFPKRHATWRLGATAGCYNAFARTLDWDPAAGSCAAMNVVQLSNRMLLPPDGASFAQEGLLGYGWVDTPFGKTSAGDGRNFWTLVFDTETFSGPAFYILPEFFAQREPGQSVPAMPDLGTCKALQMGENAAEVQEVPTFQAATGEWRLPRMRMPQAASQGRTVLSMGHKAYTRDDVGDVLERAIAARRLDTSELMARGVGSRPSCVAHTDCTADAVFTVNAGQQKTYRMGVFNTTMVDGDVVWSLQHDGCGADQPYCWLPQYLTSGMQPLPEASAPDDLRAAQFPEKTTDLDNHGPFDATPGAASARYGTCFDAPGPSDPTLHCARTLGGTWLAWRWYRFADQPALQRLNLSPEERAFMQARAEALHAMVGQKSEWMKPGGAAAVGLATLDPATLMVPPAGLEVGHVPIGVYEGVAKPGGCGDTPPQPPPPPTPPPAPTPAPAPAPAPTPSPGQAEYRVADQSYTCPSGSDPIYAADECKAAWDAVTQEPWAELKTESDVGDPPGCWVYGPTGTYQYLWLNAARSTAGTRTERSALCKVAATPPPPAPPEYRVADQSYTCPSGSEAIYAGDECKAAWDAVTQEPWAEMETESDDGDPPGCWVYGPTGAYQYLWLNAARSTTGTRTERSALCKVVAGADAAAVDANSEAHDNLVQRMQAHASERARRAEEWRAGWRE